MPVVINEFEAVAEVPPQRSAEGESAENKESDAQETEARDMVPLLRALEARALRAWAH